MLETFTVLVDIKYCQVASPIQVGATALADVGGRPANAISTRCALLASGITQIAFGFSFGLVRDHTCHSIPFELLALSRFSLSGGFEGSLLFQTCALLRSRQFCRRFAFGIRFQLSELLALCTRRGDSLASGRLGENCRIIRRRTRLELVDETVLGGGRGFPAIGEAVQSFHDFLVLIGLVGLLVTRRSASPAPAGRHAFRRVGRDGTEGPDGSANSF